MSLHNFYIMNNQTEIKITGTPSGFITCGLPQGGAAMSDTPKLLALMSASRDVNALDYSKQLEVLVRELERENAALRAVIFTQSSLLKRWLELADQQSETLDPMTYITFQKKDGLVGDTHSVLNTLNESKNT